jgi:subtilisin family serine protease
VEPQYPGDQPYMDNHFHGTHVGATVASNNVSVAGVAPRVTLIAVKVLNFIGSGSFESVASGIRHAATVADADVINMSLGANVEPGEEGVPALLELMRRVIRDAEKRGTIVISAAGNDALDLDAGTVVSTPCEQSTMCVSATGPLLQQNFDQAATYTNFGITAIEVAAPGGNAVDGDDTAYQTEDLIIGACSRRASDATLNVCRANTDGVAYFYAWAAGTSMASPHVAGAAALVKSAYPTLSVQGLARRLMRSADDVQAPGRDAYTNWGRINVARALELE